MTRTRSFLRPAPLLALMAVAVLASGCASSAKRFRPLAVNPQDQECLARAMYFESNRSSHEGMMAVGTVVMNRVASPQFPDTVCGVVGQPKQFAQGVLTKPMGAGRDLAMQTAYSVLSGYRHKDVNSRTMFFHTAGYSFPYDNMHYMLIAGGNAFYEKVSRRDREGKRLRTQAEVARR